MALPSSPNAISIDDIRQELQVLDTSLYSLSRVYDTLLPARIGFGTPDAMSEFHGYTYTPPLETAALCGGFSVYTANSSGAQVVLYKNYNNNTYSYSVPSAGTYQQISLTQLTGGYTVNYNSTSWVRLYANTISNKAATLTIYLTACTGKRFSNIIIQPSFGFQVTSQTANSSTISVTATQTSQFQSYGDLTIYFTYEEEITWTNKTLYYLQTYNGAYGLDTNPTLLTNLLPSFIQSTQFRINNADWGSATKVQYNYTSGWANASNEWLYGDSGGVGLFRYWDGEKFLGYSEAPFTYVSGNFYVGGNLYTTASNWNHDNGGVITDPFYWEYDFSLYNNSRTGELYAYYYMSTTETIYFTSSNFSNDFTYLRIYQSTTSTGPWTLRSSFSSGDVATSASINPSNGRYLRFSSATPTDVYRVMKVYYNL